MKRLTKCVNGRKRFDCNGCEKLGGDCNPGDCNKQAIARLESIEDILGEDYDLDRLRELMEADREGRVVPLRVGQKIYVALDGNVMEETVSEIIIDRETTRISVEPNFATTITYKPDIFCRWIFLTREEAEAAMERIGKA